MRLKKVCHSDMNLRLDQTKYRTYLEEGHHANEVDSWRFFEMRGPYGSCCPYSETHLSCLVLSNRIGERLRREKPHFRLIQNGENEMSFIIENKFLDEAAEIIQAKRKRQLKPEEKARLAEIGKQTRF